MPKPNAGESKSKFISRCISYVMENEGISDSKHAYAKCNGIWEQAKKEEGPPDPDLRGAFRGAIDLRGIDGRGKD